MEGWQTIVVGGVCPVVVLYCCKETVVEVMDIVVTVIVMVVVGTGSQ